MKPGGIRRIVVPLELGYPNNDFSKTGPKPTTFSVSLALPASRDDPMHEAGPRQQSLFLARGLHDKRS